MQINVYCKEIVLLRDVDFIGIINLPLAFVIRTGSEESIIVETSQ